MQIFYLYASFGGSFNIYTKGALFCLEFQLFAMWPCWFTLYQRRPEKVWLIMHYFSTQITHSSLVDGITDVDCWAQNGSTHGHVFATFRCNLFLTGPENLAQTNKQTKRYIFHSFPINRACDASYYPRFNFTVTKLLHINRSYDDIQ